MRSQGFGGSRFWTPTTYVATGADGPHSGVGSQDLMRCLHGSEP